MARILLGAVLVLLASSFCHGMTEIDISEILAGQANDPSVSVEEAEGDARILHFDGPGGQGACLQSSAQTASVVGLLSGACAASQCHTFSTSLRLLKKNFEGTLFDVSSPAGGRLHIYFSKSIQMRLIYQSGQGEVFQKFYYGFRRNRWMQVNLVICPSTVTVYVDCFRLFHEDIARPDCLVQSSSARVCAGSSTDGTSTILADIRDMIVFRGDQSARLCPHTSDKEALIQNISSLHDKVLRIENEMDSLKVDLAMERSRHSSEKKKATDCSVNSAMLYHGLTSARKQITAVNQSNVQMAGQLETCAARVKNISCTVDNEIYGVGSPVPRNCKNCTCLGNGKVECQTNRVCTPINPLEITLMCPHGYIERQNESAGICCDQCKTVPDSCNHFNVFHPHNTSFPNPDGFCSNCTCLHGRVICNQHPCPTAYPCPAFQRFKAREDCCPRCVPDHCGAADRPCTGSAYRGDSWQCKNTPTALECECFYGVINGECNSPFG